MPSYVETHDVTKPAGSRDRSLGDDDIREYKRSIDERLNEDHVKPNDESGVTTVGYHRKATLPKQASDPTVVATAGILYTKDAGAGAIELYFEDAAGNVVQLTNAGFIGGFRSGDKLLSANVTTPSGWTDQSSTYTENFIRISSGTPLNTGGANTHSHGGVTGAHQLSIAEMPAHTHSYTLNVAPGAGDSGGSLSTNSSANTGSTGGDGTHTHTVASDNNIPVYVQMKIYSKT